MSIYGVISLIEADENLLTVFGMHVAFLFCFEHSTLHAFNFGYRARLELGNMVVNFFSLAGLILGKI
jgi:hypothetical protein